VPKVAIRTLLGEEPDLPDERAVRYCALAYPLGAALGPLAALLLLSQIRIRSPFVNYHGFQAMFQFVLLLGLAFFGLALVVFYFAILLVLHGPPAFDGPPPPGLRIVSVCVGSIIGLGYVAQIVIGLIAAREVRAGKWVRYPFLWRSACDAAKIDRRSLG
jgi:hypothetical protein